jgi:FkbM family methyltransferase
MEKWHDLGVSLKSALQNNLPRSLFSLALNILIRIEAAKKNLAIRYYRDFIDVLDGLNIVRIGRDQSIYAPEIIRYFDYYFSSVEHIVVDGRNIVDYSLPRYHDVVGFNLQPIMFPSFAEPVGTTLQYMEFASLDAGMSVIDLGAYSGLTSIIFQEAVGSKGRVVAVDADERNIACIEKNFALYEKIRRLNITLVRGAVWEHNDGLEFSSEGNMGAAAVSIVGAINRGAVRRVPSFTLSAIAGVSGLKTIDFIKCDVEGAERCIFNDTTFFEVFRPRMIVETHLIGGVATTEKCIADLSAYGYRCVEVVQIGGAATPLLECHPPNNWKCGV